MNQLGSSETLVVYSAVFSLVSTAIILAQNLGRLRSRAAEILLTLLLPLIATGTAAYWSPQWLTPLMAGTVSVGLLIALRYQLPRFRLSGHLLLATSIASVAAFGCWGIPWIRASFLTGVQTGLYLGMAAFILLVPLSFGKVWLQASIFGRRLWLRPRVPLIPAGGDYVPKVSIHVPCYAEPPELVIETLEALSRLDYPNYEVIVIDNNTRDQRLWKPVEQHCARLGERFRFFHAEGIKGAKAGALNYIAPLVGDDAELVACIDSDYVAQPDFLRRLTGFFTDPEMGFVQTSHDYRQWKDRSYETACYWEYLPFYKQSLPALSEWTSSFTVGTMCIIRRRALQEAGGWAEWCLTEDSELAIRLHALGYKSVTLPDTFGRGLIPETFGDYKKQRYRWTAGPAQQLKKHYRWLLPGFSKGSSKMTAQQRYFELVHCTSGVPFVLSLLGSIVGPWIVLELVFNHQIVAIPTALLVSMLASLVLKQALTYLEYRQIGASVKDMIWGSIASMSLQHTKEVAALAGFFSSKPLQWNRTNKFAALPAGLKAFSSVWPEIGRGVATVAIALYAADHLHFGTFGLAHLGVVSLIVSGMRYLTAPLMAIIAERDLNRRAEGQMTNTVPEPTTV